jgi:hypothetical protein
VAFTLCYLGLCRVLGLLRSSRRTETDKDIEIMVLRHQVRILERQLTVRVAYRPWIGRSSLPSPGCCRDGADAPSSSRQRRSFVGTESSRGANGGAGKKDRRVVRRNGGLDRGDRQRPNPTFRIVGAPSHRLELFHFGRLSERAGRSTSCNSATNASLANVDS